MMERQPSYTEEELAARRAHPRMAGPPVAVSGLRARVHDISRGGMSLTLYAAAEVGDRFELVLTDTLVHYAQEVVAEIVWAVRGRVGMRWVGLTERQQEWLDERFSFWERERQDLTVRPREVDSIRWSW